MQPIPLIIQYFDQFFQHGSAMYPLLTSIILHTITPLTLFYYSKGKKARGSTYLRQMVREPWILYESKVLLFMPV